MSLFYELYSLREQQYLYVKDAVTRITDPVAFAPDGKSPAQVAGLAEEYATALGVLTDATLDAQDARAERAEAHEVGHAACVMVYACMKSCYRTIKKCVACITRLPKSDHSPAQTLKRMEAIAKRWNKLPNLPGGTAPLAAAGTVTKAGFTTLTNALRTAISNEVDAEQTEVDAAQEMRALDAVASSFINAALVQGRAIYPTGTPARAIIDHIPTEPSTQLPGEINFLTAESHAPGTATLQFESEHATSAKVLHKGPGDTALTEVATVLMPGGTGEYQVTGLVGGIHEYQVVPINSRGEGPASAVQSFEVAEEEVA